MQREPNRFVIGRENNVLRVDFSRDPDPPAPRFPGASGLREIGDETTERDTNNYAAAFRTAATNFSYGNKHAFCSGRLA